MELYVREYGPNRRKCLGSRAGYEQTFACRDDARGNGGNLIRALSRPENHFGEPLSDPPVMIDASEAEVFERRLAQNLKDALVRRLRR